MSQEETQNIWDWLMGVFTPDKKSDWDKLYEPKKPKDWDE